MKNKKVIFIHGYAASPKVNFYPAISKELNRLGIEYSMPVLPGHKFPHSQDWLDIIDSEVKKSIKPVILVGHSLGTRAILLYLDKYGQKINGVLLVAAFNNDLSNGKRRDENYADFFEYALDIKKIKKLANKFVVIHSKDDSAIDYNQGNEIAQELGAGLVTYIGRDHFCTPEDADAILNELLKF